MRFTQSIITALRGGSLPDDSDDDDNDQYECDDQYIMMRGEKQSVYTTDHHPHNLSG